MAIGALGNLIAENVSDSAQLAVLAAIFTQLGDTLNTIIAVRALKADDSDSCSAANPQCTGPAGSSPRCRRPNSCPENNCGSNRR
ncbi:MAG: DUF6774 domain-containing protein [Oscillospiraceae bacterium]